ncbi:sugar ABC transporter substrate-binding protein [Deinococcus sp. QL22]|uniref:ABC transporter substrate-binding protein n=1 Tax=Deinococcus sp. QL22 TaxID=2939437 RepID=UPI0020171ED4|nr:sugar ABC transporter substrate-binding protein [Deinococcus sp. QL22]UQN09105.1 sugar ABC transporter substrate-binding protein [Deinococcus sp. QL22]
MTVLLALTTVLVPSAAQAQTLKWDAYKGTSLRLLLNQHPWTTAIQPYFPEFEKLTGIKLVVETYPEAQFRQKVLVELSTGGANLDAFMLSPGQEGQLYARSGWVEDMDNYVNNRSLLVGNWAFSDFYPSVVKSTQYAGVMTGIPIQTETTMLFYRKDLFQKYQIAVPKTLTQLEAAAKALNGKDGVVGIALRGKGAAATSQFAPYMYSSGSTWLNASGEANYSDAKFVGAMNLYTRLIRNYGPAAAVTMSWPEVTNLFAQGKAAMFTDASLFRSIVDDPKSSTVAGKVGFAAFPAGAGGRKPTVTTWALALSKGSKNKQAGWLFTQWATNRQNQLRVLLKEVPAVRRSVWNDAAFKAQDKNPEWTRAHLSQLASANPQWNPPVSSVGEVRDALGQAIVGILQGGNTQTLLRTAQQATDAIISKEK